jgi:hypothetical protein
LNQASYAAMKVIYLFHCLHPEEHGLQKVLLRLFNNKSADILQQPGRMNALLVIGDAEVLTFADQLGVE